MKPPTTYAEWAACCDRLLNGDCDDETLAAMESGKLEWTSGVAERITKRIHEVFDSRLKSLAERFQRDLDRSRGHDTLLTNALLGIRKNLLSLARLSRLPTLPEMVTQSLKQSLQQYAEKTQSSLEASARSDRTGRLLSIIKRNKVCVPDVDPALAGALPAQTNSESEAAGNASPRRIILT
ncbi:MAG: hypothetical protein HY735_08760 [Verrucomicrobia bacterium]|nr:hypothetical protein [Verrucomicrobiota bacterium]